eukprot:gene4033-4409_t
MEVINLLLQASSKTAIEQTLNLIFLTRNEPSLSLLLEDEEDRVSIIKTLRTILGFPVEDVSDHQIAQLRQALLECIEVTLSSFRLEDLVEFFNEEGKDINPKLKQLLGQTIGSRMETWKEASSLSRISLPRLQDFDWSLQFQRASSEVAEMQIPTVIMSLQVESNPTLTSSMSKVETIDIEMNREALETMIDGLGKIRDQLSGMK